MILNRKRMGLAGSVIVVIMFFALFRVINRSIERHITDEVQKIKNELTAQEIAQEPKREPEPVKRKLVASDITPYTITPQRKSNMFKNQQYWDIETRKSFLQQGDVDDLRDGDVFKGVTRSDEHLGKQIERIESRIREYKRKIRNDPYEDYARQKLQDLYMLKSTVRILSESKALGQ